MFKNSLILVGQIFQFEDIKDKVIHQTVEEPDRLGGGSGAEKKRKRKEEEEKKKEERRKKEEERKKEENRKAEEKRKMLQEEIIRQKNDINTLIRKQFIINNFSTMTKEDIMNADKNDK